MILQTLCKYYTQQVQAGNPNYAPAGMELKRIHFVLVLGSDGTLIDIEQPLRKFNVVKSRYRSKEAELIANGMWDSLGYVVGYGADEKLRERAVIQHSSFKEQVRETYSEFPENATFAAVRNFYSSHDYAAQLENHSLWSKIISLKGHNLSFRLSGETLLASQQPELIGGQNDKSSSTGCCMVSGKKAKIATIHPKIAIAGGSPTGTKLVSFTKRGGYDSYYKKNGDNAPISIEAAEQYAASLNGLLQYDSPNRVVVADVSFVFFSMKKCEFDSVFRTLLDPWIKTGEQEAFEALGSFVGNTTEFVFMALVPNAARVSVRLFIRTTVGAAAQNIIRFYDQTTLRHNFNLSGVHSLLSPLLLCAPQRNVSKLPVQLIVEYMRAVVENTPLPVTLQSELLCRIRESKEEVLGIMTMLRCFMNRNNPKNYIPMALDKENSNTGYLLGRTFAILERAHELSNPGLTFTIKDAYYTIASVTPSAVFNRLMGLSNTYFRRVSTPGTAVYLKIQLGEVTGMLGADGIPARLSLDDQSRFALGYFHQRQTYFTKKEQPEVTG